MAKIYYDKDANLSLIKGRTIGIVGFGSQGHAHSQNLRDSGIKVQVAELPDTDNYKLAIEHGFKPTDIAGAVKNAALIIVTLPDEVQSKVYETQKRIEPKLVFSYQF